MGSLLVEEALRQKGHFQLTGVLEQAGHPEVGRPLPQKPDLKVSSNLDALIAQADLLVEFTTPDASVAHAKIAAQAKLPMVIGTTGFSEDQLDQLRQFAKQTPIFWSPNMSIGITLVRRLIREGLALLTQLHLADPSSLKMEVFEIHHTQKKDAPSGTAKQLAQDLAAASGRNPTQIPIGFKREGEVVGLHRIRLDLMGSERIVLEHEATSRKVFAEGALLAARHFYAQAKNRPGWYGMDDVVRSLAR